MNPALKPHQKDSVLWAVKGGRRALFAAFGLGKTACELEYCRLVTQHEGGCALIVLPLGVKQEFTHDAKELLGWERAPEYIRTSAEAEAAEKAGARILMTNYERVRDGDIDPKDYTACALDEASILRSFGSKTYQEFLVKFRGVKYKLCATATPDPNKYKEIIHYAGFLEVMDTGQALTRFFKRDSTKANNLTLYPHKEAEFWLWVSTWALLIEKPSDLGYSDEGYALPEIEIRYHKLKSDNNGIFDRDGQMKLQREAAAGLSDAAKEKRTSLAERVDEMKKIVDGDPAAHFVLWHDLEDERHAIKAALPEAVEVFGTQDIDEREKRIIDFSEGRTRLLATKKEISGQGCNFQKHCHRAIFLGIDYKFNDFIKAIHRIYRFLQTQRVIIDIIYTENESEILEELLKKWDRHREQTAKMTEIVRKYGLGGARVREAMGRSIGVERVEVRGANFRAINNDCVEETRNMETDTVGMILTSIPFSNHYEYTPSYNDFGHNDDTAAFFKQMDYLSPELLRVLQPGRIFCCHVKDRVLFGGATGDGTPTIEPFHALAIEHYMKHGFVLMGMITVITDVVRENAQTYRLGWTECCKDGTKMGVGCPEYILIFRKLPTDRSRAYADVPVTKEKSEYTRAQWQLDAHAFWRSGGDRLLTKDEIGTIPEGMLQKVFNSRARESCYSYAEHVELCKEMDKEGRLPAGFMVVAPPSWNMDVWDDILRIKTLNTTQSARRQQMHVCPLQLDIIERCINRYSNPGDVVYDPFAGIFSVPYMAVKMGRYGLETELSNGYFRDGVGYLQEADAERDAPTLFDFVREDA